MRWLSEAAVFSTHEIFHHSEVRILDVQYIIWKKLTWLNFSIWATSRGKRWARAESFSVLTCLTSERSSTSPSYAIGKMDVSFTEVLHKADITAASRRLLDVRKLASAMSWNTGRTRRTYLFKPCLIFIQQQRKYYRKTFFEALWSHST